MLLAGYRVKSWRLCRICVRCKPAICHAVTWAVATEKKTVRIGVFKYWSDPIATENKPKYLPTFFRTTPSFAFAVITYEFWHRDFLLGFYTTTSLRLLIIPNPLCMKRAWSDMTSSHVRTRLEAQAIYVEFTMAKLSPVSGNLSNRSLHSAAIYTLTP